MRLAREPEEKDFSREDWLLVEAGMPAVRRMCGRESVEKLVVTDTPEEAAALDDPGGSTAAMSVDEVKALGILAMAGFFDRQEKEDEA